MSETPSKSRNWFITCGIIITMSLLARQFAAIRAFDFHVTGWALALWLITIVGLVIAKSYLTGFLSALFEVKLTGIYHKVAESALNAVTVPIAFFFTAALLPEQAGYTSGLGYVLLMLLLGTAIGIDNYLQPNVE